MTMPIDDTLRANADGTAIAVKAKGLAGCPPGRIWFDLARTWAVIVAALAVFALAPSFLVFVVCFVVVAAQQYALLILMHDGQHSLLHRRREINNLISKWLIGAPCGTPFFSSQKQHLTHHRTLVGCGDGWMLYLFKLADPKRIRTFGVDINEKVCAAARSRGHTVYCGLFEDVQFDQQFDVINLSNVIEHVTDPGRRRQEGIRLSEKRRHPDPGNAEQPVVGCAAVQRRRLGLVPHSAPFHVLQPLDDTASSAPRPASTWWR